MEKAKKAVIALLTAMKKRADEETAARIGELIAAVEAFEPAQRAA